MSRRNKKKKNKGNHLRDFKSRAICPECSSGKITMLNKARGIFKCLACEHKFIYDDGVYDTLESKKEQVAEIQEEKEVVATADPLNDFFENLKV